MAKKENVRKRIFDIIQIGNKEDLPSVAFDIGITVMILLNLFATLFSTFEASKPFAGVLNVIDIITVVVFTAEFILRIITADYLYPKRNPVVARILFIFSFYGLIDLLTILPFYLPFIFPAGAVAFRMFRVVRIFRLFKINAQFDAFNVIINVLKEKRNQIFSCITMIIILTIASSLCMYSVEHEAQPDQFANAFSGIWWSVSTLLTVGYGDIYPVTTLGRIMAIIISFLGVGMVAIPTGIISAGFVEQFTKMKTLATSEEKHDVHFVVSDVSPDHPWVGKAVKEITLPPEVIVAVIYREDLMMIPKPNTVIEGNDRLILGSHFYEAEDDEVVFTEILIKSENPWVGKRIRDLDITRRELVVRIRSGPKERLKQRIAELKNEISCDKIFSVETSDTVTK